MSKKVSSEKVVQDIRRKTRKKFSSEKKIRIILEDFQSRTSAFGRKPPLIPPAQICCHFHKRDAKLKYY